MKATLVYLLWLFMSALAGPNDALRPCHHSTCMEERHDGSCRHPYIEDNGRKR